MELTLQVCIINLIVILYDNLNYFHCHCHCIPLVSMILQTWAPAQGGRQEYALALPAKYENLLMGAFFTTWSFFSTYGLFSPFGGGGYFSPYGELCLVWASPPAKFSVGAHACKILLNH